MNILSAIDRIDRLRENPNIDDIRWFLVDATTDDLAVMYREADRIRKELVGDKVHLRAILEISNHCRRECLYCGINCKTDGVERYRIPPEEIVVISKDIYNKGYRTLVIQSGEDMFYTAEILADVIRGIKKNAPDMAITLSVGERDEAAYRMWFEAGADRYLLKHETSDRDLYHKLNPGMSFDDRIKCLNTLHAIGFQIGSGIMIGLPGQTRESIAGDILLFKTLQTDMIGAGPYIPVPGQPTEWSEHDREDITYRVLALNRIVNGDVHLPATTALSTLAEDQARLLALQRGANIVMPNETPAQYRKLYTIYPNKKRTEASAATSFLDNLEKLLATIGRPISFERADHVKR